MYDINTLKGLNEARFKQLQASGLKNPVAETETNRRCSFHQSKAGIVLHSAKRRSTAFIGGVKNVKKFLLAYWGTNSLDKRDQVIEGYFA